MVFKVKTNEKTPEILSAIKSYSLPVYIVVSAVFILYVLWSYAMGVVYNAWVNAGKNQALQGDQEQDYMVAMEQGYVTAIEQILQEATASCDVISLTLWDEQVNMVNIDCLDMWQWVDDFSFEEE